MRGALALLLRGSAGLRERLDVHGVADEGAHDDEAAALLLAGLSEGPATTEVEQATDSSGVPTGSTIDMEVPPGGAKPPAKAEPTKKAKEGEADTSKSAAAILEKYRRRPRQ